MSDEKINTIPHFSGKKKDYQEWHNDFGAYCFYGGCLKALKPSMATKLPKDEETELDRSDPTQKAQDDARKLNTKAVYALRIALKLSLIHI